MDPWISHVSPWISITAINFSSPPPPPPPAYLLKPIYVVIPDPPRHLPLLLLPDLPPPRPDHVRDNGAVCCRSLFEDASLSLSSGYDGSPQFYDFASRFPPRPPRPTSLPPIPIRSHHGEPCGLQVRNLLQPFCNPLVHGQERNMRGFQHQDFHFFGIF